MTAKDATLLTMRIATIDLILRAAEGRVSKDGVVHSVSI